MTATREIKGETRTQIRYHLLSQAFDPADFDAIARTQLEYRIPDAREPSKGSMRGKLKRAGWNTAFLFDLLSHFGSPLNAIALHCSGDVVDSVRQSPIVFIFSGPGRCLAPAPFVCGSAILVVRRDADLPAL